MLLLDSDSLVLADPYPFLRSHFSDYTAVCVHDLTAGPLMLVNGGTWYIHGAQARSGRLSSTLPFLALPSIITVPIM